VESCLAITAPQRPAPWDDAASERDAEDEGVSLEVEVGVEVELGVEDGIELELNVELESSWARAVAASRVRVPRRKVRKCMACDFDFAAFFGGQGNVEKGLFSKSI
jgi:hypothetical protein